MTLNHKVYGEGPPLIILHGLFGSLENWHYISGQLSDRFQVIAVDQRNHGRSPHHPQMNYRVLAEDIRQLIEQRGIQSANVLGHSMGGKAAMRLTLDHPECVLRLVVVDIAPRQYEPSHRHILEALRGLELSRFQTRLEMDEALAGAIPEPAVRQFLLKSVSRDEHGFRWRMNLEALAANYSEITAGLVAGKSSDIPALFVSGEQSDYIRPEDHALIRGLFPRATFRVIPGAGHWVHAESPAAFLQSVIDFLA